MLVKGKVEKVDTLTSKAGNEFKIATLRVTGTLEAFVGESCKIGQEITVDMPPGKEAKFGN